MKRMIIIATALASAIFANQASAADLFGKKLRGSGKIVTETRTSKMDFSKIDVSRCVKLTISDSREGDIVVKADDNVMPYLIIEARKGVFTATLSDKIGSMENFTVEITMPYNGRIDDIEASGASSVNVIPTLEADEVELDASSASKIEARVKARKCGVDASGASKIVLKATADIVSIDASGASKVDAEVETASLNADVSGASKSAVSGSAANAFVESSGASKLDASKLTAAKCTASASGASKVAVHCTSELRAEASGASSISYTGDCSLVQSHESGASRISKQ